MLNTVILKNNYQDSINLMLLTNKINDFENVTMSQVMMGTDANKDILQNTNLLTAEAETASPNDLMIVVDSADEDVMEEVLSTVEEFLSDLSSKGGETKTASTSWAEALEALPDANMALFSIPGEYGAASCKNSV